MTTAPSWSLLTPSGHEETDEQLALNGGVDRRALGNDELVEVGLLLEADEGPHAMARELRGRRHDLFDDLRLLLSRETPEERLRADAHEAAADVVLEHDHHHEDDRREEGREQVGQRHQAQVLGAEVHQEDDAETNSHLHRACAAKDEQRAVDEVRDDDDVEHVDRNFAPGTRLEQMEEPLRHRPTAVSARGR